MCEQVNVPDLNQRSISVNALYWEILSEKCDFGHSYASTIGNISANLLRVVSATFLLVCFLCLKKSTCETRKSVFYFTSKALFIFEVIKF